MSTKLEALQDTLELVTDLYLITGDGKAGPAQIAEIVEKIDEIVEQLGQEIANEHANN